MGYVMDRDERWRVIADQRRALAWPTCSPGSTTGRGPPVAVRVAGHRVADAGFARFGGVPSDDVTGPDLAWQPSLLDGGAVGFDDTFAGLQRRDLTEGAWVDHLPGWCHGSDGLFARLLTDTPWSGRTVRMYDRVVAEPRLTHRWVLDSGPAVPDDLQEMARVLSGRYGVRFSHVECHELVSPTWVTR